MRFRIKWISEDSFVYALVSICLCGISLQLLQANLDNGTAGGMSTSGFKIQVILHGYFMKTSEWNLLDQQGGTI